MLIGIIPLVKDKDISLSDNSPPGEVIHDLGENRGIIGGTTVNLHGKWSHGRIVDDKCQFISDVVAMGWGVAPGILLIFKVLLCIMTSKPVQVQVQAD